MSVKVSVYKRKLKTGRTALYLKYYDKGKRTLESLDMSYAASDSKEFKQKLLDIAEEKRTKEQLRIFETGTFVESNAKAEGSFIEYFQKFTDKRNPNNGNSEPIKRKSKKQKESDEKKSSSSYYNYKSALKNIKEFVKEKYKKNDITIAEINKDFIEDFNYYLEHTKGKSKNTVVEYYSKLRAVINSLEKSKLIKENPLKYLDVKPKTERPAIVYLTIDEVQKLWETPPPNNNEDYKDAFIFCCFCNGLRFSDVSKLRFSDIHGNYLHFQQTKTHQYEYFPIHETAMQIINKKKKQQKIFNPDKKIFDLPTNFTINKFLRKWVRNAGINKDVTFHVSRHTFGTLSIANDVDIYVLSKMMGHKDVKTTQIYAKVLGKNLMEGINKLPKLSLE